MSGATEVAQRGSEPSVEQVLPSTLTHYYRDKPLRTLSDLSDAGATAIVDKLARDREPEFRLTREEYLPRRLQIEALMRTAFIAKGGRPKREHPHYFILGEFSLYEQDTAMRSLRVPLDAITSDAISFTYTDSFFAFNNKNLRGVSIPSRPYHGQVFRLEEMPDLIELHGLPGERWRNEPDRIFDVYIEAQVWDNEPLRPYVTELP